MNKVVAEEMAQVLGAGQILHDITLCQDSNVTVNDATIEPE